jgi:hypothetical protein
MWSGLCSHQVRASPAAAAGRGAWFVANDEPPRGGGRAFVEKHSAARRGPRNRFERGGGARTRELGGAPLPRISSDEAGWVRSVNKNWPCGVELCLP